MARIILVVLIILVTILIIWTVVSTRRSFRNDKVPIQKISPLSEKYAIVKEKYIDEVMTGSYQMPGHYLSYQVRFGFDDGTETGIGVSKEVFEQIPIGSREVLLTEGDQFLDFGGRFGVPLPNDDVGKNDLKS